MPDQEVLKSLECLITNEVPCEGCPYNGSGYCLKNIAKDARELLKEMEPNGDDCGECGHPLHGIIYYGPYEGMRHERFRFCPLCGRRVKLDATDKSQK